jgi:hypothetical protein
MVGPRHVPNYSVVNAIIKKEVDSHMLLCGSFGSDLKPNVWTNENNPTMKNKIK